MDWDSTLRRLSAASSSLKEQNYEDEQDFNGFAFYIHHIVARTI